jgi:hypothetical protein
MDALIERLRETVPCVGLLSDEELAAILAAIQETHVLVERRLLQGLACGETQAMVDLIEMSRS